MSNFHYPSPENSSEQWQELSPEASRALGDTAVSNHATSLAGPEQAVSNLEGLDNDVRQWAETQLAQAIDSWGRREHQLGLRIPLDMEELSKTHPNLILTLSYLYKAFVAMKESSVTAPDAQSGLFGKPVSNTLQLVLLPWQGLKNNRADINGWLETLAVPPFLQEAVNDGKPFYFDRDREVTYTAEEYLDKKLQQEGPWGVMLMQASSRAGSVASQLDFGPAEFMHEGRSHWRVGNFKVDSLGLFEWLALTTQIRHGISEQDYSWLLANWEPGTEVLPAATHYVVTRKFIITPNVMSGTLNIAGKPVRPRYVFAWESKDA